MAGAIFSYPPGGAGAGTFGQETVDFANGGVPAVTVAVADAGVGAGSHILASIGGVSAGRDVDELEMSALQVVVGAISAGVGFDLLVLAEEEDATGTFLVNWTRD